jgi:hypothetical protein
MKRTCSKEGCNAPNTFCKELAGPNFQDCDHWKSVVTKDSNDAKKFPNGNSIPWSGLAMEPHDLHLLSHRSTPQIIGLIGNANAGKTSYLGMLYTLLFNGKQFDEWRFTGSQTLIAWETQAKSLKVKPNGKVPFPKPTPSSGDYYSLYHLSLKKDEDMQDLFFADSSGEVFTKWANNTNDPNAENARWIYENSNAFMLFVDCEAIIDGKAKARRAISQLAGQISSSLKNRPVAIVWSKSDKIDEILPNIKLAIDKDIRKKLPNALSIEISNFSKTDPDILCHKNNILVTERLLNTMNEPDSNRLEIQLDVTESTDFFYLYRGSYGSE